MHRRVFAAISLVIVLSMSTPLFAASRHSSSDSFIDLKKIFYPIANDLNDVTPPKP